MKKLLVPQSGIVVIALVVSIGLFSTGCKKEEGTTGPPPGGGLTANPSSITVQAGQQANATISGGTQPYSIQTAPNTSIATATITGATLTVAGVAAGSTSVIVRDNLGANTVAVSITVTTGGGGGYGSGTISSTSTTQGNLSFTGQGVWPVGAGPSVIAVYDTVRNGLQILGYQQVSGRNYSFILVQFLAPGGVSARTYTVTDSTAGVLIATNVDTNRADTLGFAAISGTITVSSVSGTNVVGSFSVSAIRRSDLTTASFTGSFNVTYVHGRAVLDTGRGGGTASLTLNGAGFTNQTFNLSRAYSFYQSGITGVGAQRVAAGDSVYLVITFPGSTTGTFSWIDTSGVFLARNTPGSRRSFFSQPGSGTTVVSAYGSVNGNVVGTFSGKLYEFTGAVLDSVTVTNGAFTAARVQ